MSSNIKTDKNEIWITDTDSQALVGTGTIKGNGLEQTPFYGDIDAIIEASAANYVLRFTSGTFYMAGYQEASGDPSNIKTGQRWVGAGMFQTTLKYGGTDPNTNGVVMVNALAGTDDVEISDMTIDCDGDDNDTYKRMQVGFKGSNSAIRRIRAINSTGNISNNEEAFGLLVGNPGTTNNHIEGCVCSGFFGDYVNAITLQGQAFASNNTITQRTVTWTGAAFSPVGRYWGINMINCDGAIIHNNHISRGNKSAYADTGDFSNVKFIGNTFDNIWRGIEFTGSGIDVLNTMEILNNTFIIDSTTDWAAGGHGIAIEMLNSSGTTWENLLIRGNVAKIDGDGIGEFRFIRWKDCNGVIVHDNTVGPGATLTELDAAGSPIVGDESVLLDNYDTNAVAMPTTSPWT